MKFLLSTIELRKFYRYTYTKTIIAAAMILFLQSCVPFGLYQNAFNAAGDFLNPKPFIITPQIRSLPYAMLLVEHQRNSVLMVLAYAENDNLFWVDNEQNGFTTLNGKIIATNGLANDFDSIYSPNILEVFKMLKLKNFKSLTKESLIRFKKPESPYFKAIHQFNMLTSERNIFVRKIDGKLVDYIMLEESVEVPSIKWNFKNIYWISLDGKILRSKQFVSPDQPKYFLEIIKDYKTG